MVTIVSKCFWEFSIHYIDFKIQNMYIDILKIKLYTKYIFNFFKILVVQKHSGYYCLYTCYQNHTQYVDNYCF